MDKQAREAKEMVKNMTFKEKLAHFWNYYKIHTIVTLVILGLIGVTVYQIASNEEYDLEIEFYGTRMVSEEQAAALEEYLKDYVDDIDGDGEKTVNVVRTGSLSEMGAPGYGNMKFTAELAAGQYNIYILNEEMYNAFSSNDDGMFIQSFDIRENPKCAELLGMAESDEPTYWCLVKFPESMQDKEESKLKMQNAENATNAILD